jgi:DNA-binding transcriptional regulator YbjK
MASAASETASFPRMSRSDQREHTRLRILDAVLELVVEEGMRAVRHRAVAERAGVSLGSTTYHFSSIEELIISAFDYWRSRRQLINNPFYLEMEALLQPYGEARVSESDLPEVASRILELSLCYLIDQISDKRDDRIVEFAFYHESMLYPSLRELVVQGWATQQSFLEQVHRQIGSDCPVEDAILTSMLFRQWEQATVMSDAPLLDVAAIRRSLHRHMSLCFGFEIPSTAVPATGDQGYAY